MERSSHYKSLIALQLIPDLGPRRIKKLLEQAGGNNAAEVFKLSGNHLLGIDGIGGHIVQSIKTFDGWAQADKILEQTIKLGAELVAIDDPEYPPLLRHIYDPPPLLWLKGDRNALHAPGIALIGTRRPGKYGLQQAEKWAEMLCDAGLCINSGLAYGIDSAAHSAAIKAGGKTIAVLGSGIDVIYPAKNTSLARTIAEGNGAVITEYPPGTKPDAVNFPERNRIVSGMSHGVLVAESGIKGGSMITARCALDQNREVFVVPHQADYLKGEGGNYLIKTGQGKLVQAMQDILEEISVDIHPATSNKTGNKNQKKWRSEDLNTDSRKICEILETGEHHIDSLSEETGRQTYELLPNLLELEMVGIIKQKAGKYFELC